MANWYDDGIQGQIAYGVSSGISEPAAYYGNHLQNLDSPHFCDSISLNANFGASEPYTILLNTFSLGTQLYGRVTHTRRTRYVRAGLLGPTQVQVDYMEASISFYLKKNETSVNLTTYGPVSGSEFCYVVGGGEGTGGYEFNIYKYNFIDASGDIKAINAFPFAGESGGLTNQIAMTMNAQGLTFWVCGFSSVLGPYGPSGSEVYPAFSCPVYKLFDLPKEILNDPYWFDPIVDAYQEEEGTGEGEGGNIPSLPVSPTYPGTDIDFPTLPTGADAFGFSRLKLYKPSSSQLADGLDILYSDTTESTLELIIESIKKWVYKPDQYCISLMISGVDASTSTSETIKFGKYDSEVLAPVVSSQWHIVDCGSISVPLKFGSFIDFEPHAKIKIYLPYVGFRTMNANEVIGGIVYIKYYVDILSGAAVCMVKIAREGSNSSILYTFDCNVCLQVPLTAETYTGMISTLLSAGVAAVSMGAGIAATGGAATPLVVSGAAQIGGSLAQAATGITAPEMTQSGNLSANTGVLSHPKPYICVQMPVPTTPSNYSTIKGRPSNIYVKVGQCRGLTSFQDLHVDISGATQEERDAIKAAFQRGVML